MTLPHNANSHQPRTPRSFVGRWIRRLALGCGCLTVLLVGFVVSLAILIAGAIPQKYPVADHPIEPASRRRPFGGGLDGFDSPYLGHTGSWNGKGGTMFGASKDRDLDQEVMMGLRWTFMCVYWRVMEPDAPVDLRADLPLAWQSLDQFVIAAHQRKLNILMQAPVVGGNAGGPPAWSGRRNPGRSAPDNMEALADFAGKLAQRYCPGGTLATEQGWGQSYGVRAWELDNEPESYRTNWKGQAGDYAEFGTLAAARIKSVDPEAVIVMPAIGGGGRGIDWLEQTLDAHAKNGSESFRQRQTAFSIGPATDVVSFHLYEGLDTFFAGQDRTIGQAFSDVRGVFEEWESRSAGFEYARKKEYWHTEGNFDFLGLLSQERRAAWRWQFFTRAFACGIRKVAVMDAKGLEQSAVREYVRLLPNPFPMLSDERVQVVSGNVSAFRHPSNETVWVIWANAGTGTAVVDVPATRNFASVHTVDGKEATTNAADGFYRLELAGDEKMAPPVIIVEQSKREDESGSDVARPNRT